MTVQQFNTLSQHDQLRSLLLRGACIGDRKNEGLQVLLFQLKQFYVEVYFSPECDEIISSRHFEDIDELQPYLEHVNLSGLL